MANLPADQAAGLASLMARGNDLSVLESLVEKRQTSQMSATIDSYIANLKQAGFVPNAKPTISTRDDLDVDSPVEKRDVPSLPLVINLLEQHGFVPVNGTTSKRDISNLESALEERTTTSTLPDINLVISRLEAHGFVPTGNKSVSSIAKRDASSDVNTIISELEAYGFNPNDYIQPSASGTPSTSSSTEPNCPSDTSLANSDNTAYTDAFGVKYTVSCSTGLSGTFAYTGAYTATFSECMEFCSLLGGCQGVTYNGSAAIGAAPATQHGYCNPYYSYSGKASQNSSPGLYAAVPVTAPASYSTNPNGALGTPSLCGQNQANQGVGFAVSNTTFTDHFGKTYDVGCGQYEPSGNTNLVPTSVDSIEECITYCSLYSGCIGMQWSQYKAQGSYNCYPLSAIGARVPIPKYPNAWAALH